MSTIDAASAASAKAAAKRTDKPQPVKHTDGSIAYYVTPSGTILPASYAGLWNNTSAVTPKATDPATGITYSRDASGKVTRVEHPGDPARQAAADQAAAATKAQAAAGSDATKLGAANAAHGYVWVNGQLQQIVGLDAHGVPIINYVGGGLQTTGKDGKVTKDPTKPNQVATAFGAIPSHSSLDGAATFTLSSGPANIFTGTSDSGDGFGTPGTAYTPKGVGLTPAAAEHSASANTVGAQGGPVPKNQMTVAQGVQWFLNLSVQHPDQYQHLIDMMHGANYLSDGQAAQAKGGYSSDAAGQFALATMDLAQINTTAGGAGLGLFDFLDGKAKAAKSQTESVVQPVRRDFQDPATLAYSARQAAQNVLGRNLTPAEEAAFEASFHGKENTYYDGIDAANKAQAGAAAMNTSAPGAKGTQPDTTGEADQFVNGDQFTTQRQGYSMLEYLKAFQTMLGSGKL